MMIVKKQKILFFISILLFVIYLGYPLWSDAVKVFSPNGDNYYMDVPSISQERLSELIEGKKMAVLEEGVFFNYSKVPMDIEEQTIYISQNTQKAAWEGNFSMEQFYRKAGYSMYFLEDDFFENKEEAIRQGHEFSLYIIGEDYYKFNVVFSGLGIISISEQYELPKEEIDYFDDPDAYVFDKQIECIGEVTVLSAEEEVSYQTIQGYVKYRIKGATSANYPKKSYAITFIDKGGKDVSISALGMDSYHKWKLNALYLDDTLVREKSAIDIWSLVDQQNTNVDNGSFQAEYVELVCNGSYEGVYLLVEAVDDEKLGLDNNDILYKSISWDIATLEAIDESVAYEWKVAAPYRIRYPKEISNYQNTWAPIREYMNVFFWNGDIGNRTLQQRVNIENLIDVNIVLEICALRDNNYKNLYIAAHMDEAGTYVMSHHLWDMDMSFDFASGETEEELKTSVTRRYVMPVLDSIMSENQDVMGLFHDTYAKYRTSFLSDDTINEIINTNWALLENSGAYQRNHEVWKKDTEPDTVEETLRFVSERLKYLDSIY